MSLYRRLIGLDEPKIPVHQFMAAVAEFKRGKFTAPQVIAMFQLTAAEQVEMAALRGRVVADQLNAEEIHDVCLLAESGFAYATETEIKTRFGVS